MSLLITLQLQFLISKHIDCSQWDADFAAIIYLQADSE